MTMSNPPKVFISYSWSNDEYKATVLQLAEALVGQSVDVILDRWDLHAGHDRFAFMEQSIEKADKVLVLCDKKYAEKANAREGGVGTETAIITPDIYGKNEQEKFIPVIMEDFKFVPTYLKSRLGIDLTKTHYEEGFKELLHAIYGKPIHEKPPLGKPPEWINKSRLDPKHSHLKENDERIETKDSTESIEQMILSSFDGKHFTASEIATKTGRTLNNVHRILRDMLRKNLILRVGKWYVKQKQEEVPDKISACIKAWQDVINPATGRVHDDAGLRALNAILYGPVREVEEVTEAVAEDMKSEFVKLHPDFKYDHIEIHTK